MPKVGLSDLEKRRRTIRACLASKKVLNGWGDDRLASKGCMSMQTFARRMQSPEDFTLKELWGMGLTVYVYDGQSVLPSEEGIVELRGVIQNAEVH